MATHMKTTSMLLIDFLLTFTSLPPQIISAAYGSLSFVTAGFIGPSSQPRPIVQKVTDTFNADEYKVFMKERRLIYVRQKLLTAQKMQ
jgi:hypothetical protein